MKLLRLFPAALILGATPSPAQTPGSNVATVTARATSAARGGRGVLTLTVRVAPGFHINAHKPNDPDLIPTTFQGTAPPGVTFGPTRFPTPKAVTVSYEKRPMLVYTGRTMILVPFDVARTVRPGRLTLAGTFSFQGCNATSCFPPVAAPVRATVTVK
jgi:DsbC/DsbD-like thiol-disulfide interchange protein